MLQEGQKNLSEQCCTQIGSIILHECAVQLVVALVLKYCIYVSIYSRLNKKLGPCKIAQLNSSYLSMSGLNLIMEQLHEGWFSFYLPPLLTV